MCLDCGRPFEGDRERGRPNVCGGCKGKRSRAPKRRAYSEPAYRAVPLVGVCACPGCGRTEDLTRDHVTPLAMTLAASATAIRCRPCNSSKGNTSACRLDHS